VPLIRSWSASEFVAAIVGGNRPLLAFRESLSRQAEGGGRRRSSFIDELDASGPLRTSGFAGFQPAANAERDRL